MMEPETPATPGLHARRLRRRAVVSRGRRFLLTAVAISVAVHIAAALLVVLLPRLLPREARPEQEATLELLMIEKKGTQPSSVPDQRQESQPTSGQAAPGADATEAASPPVPPLVETGGGAPLPRMDGTSHEVTKAEGKPDSSPPSAPTRPQEAPVFDFSGTESQSNAEVLGGHIIPASPDNRFRNRPPIYPRDAAMRGEHGAVVLVIHVSETGVATGADVVQSSGVDALDQAAVDAVRKWHFRPALQEGRSVPFNMPFRFIFDMYRN
jgi:periplasmic protein TonB